MDGGGNWQSQSSGTNATLNGVAVVDAQTIVAVEDGGVIRQSIDGGATWLTATTGVTTPTLRGVAAAGAAWAVSNGGILLTTASAPTATPTPTLTTTPLPPTATHTPTPGAPNWEGSAPSNTTTLVAVGAADTQTLWVAGVGGTLRKSTDSGSTWTTQSAGTSARLRSVGVASASTASGLSAIAEQSPDRQRRRHLDGADERHHGAPLVDRRGRRADRLGRRRDGRDPAHH